MDLKEEPSSRTALETGMRSFSSSSSYFASNTGPSASPLSDKSRSSVASDDTDSRTSTKPKDNGSLANVPTIVKALGYGGAIPFWAFSPTVAAHLPLEVLVGPLASNPGTMQIAYGATIISFLGGVHWGLAMTSLTPVRLLGQRYVWSVVPCLLAWPSVALPVPEAAGLQAVILGLVYVADKDWAKRGLLPPWYMTLRARLTTLATAGCLLTVAGAWTNTIS